MELTVSPGTMHEIANLADGLYRPVEGYMDRAEHRSVTDRVRLRSGETFPLPIALTLPQERDDLKPGRRVALSVNGNPPFCEIEITDRYSVDLRSDLQKIFGTRSLDHPGVAQEIKRGQWRAGARILKIHRGRIRRSAHYQTPLKIQRLKKKLGLQTLVGFQTRNAVHRAHERLLRTAMELFDAVLIQPLVGDRKEGDFSEKAIVVSYQALLRHYFPPGKALFATWQETMRYAGPREALLHALVRRNFGCTHFIVGRDQAGVGGFYGRYEAQKFCLAHPLPGIQILPLAGPFWCRGCDEMVTERTCRHRKDHPGLVEEISGSRIRELLTRKEAPGPEMLRPEVTKALLLLDPKATFL